MNKNIKLIGGGLLLVIILVSIMSLFSNPERQEIKRKIETNEIKAAAALKEYDLHQWYIDDLESIKHHVDAALKGKDHDQKLMYKYFGRICVWPKEMKKKYDELYKEHDYKGKIASYEYNMLMKENDSLLNVLEK